METTLLPSYNELCLSAKALQKNIHLHLAQLAQLILSLGSLALLIIAIWTYKRNKLVLHFNFILIMTNIIILYALNSIALIAEPLRYQILLLLDSDACNFLSPKWLVVMIRFPSLLHVHALVLFHFALTTERTRATFFAKRYEKEGSKYALLCTIIIWILSVTYISCMVILAWNDVTFQSPAIFSTLTNDRNSTYLISSHTFCLMVVIITAITDYFLLYTNRKNRSKVDVDYSLSRTYQINENIIVMKLIWPLDICFAVVFTFHLVGATCLRLIREKLTFAQFLASYQSVYLIIPLHSIVTLLLYMHFVKNNKMRTAASMVELGDHTERYFKQLESQWNANYKRPGR